MSEVKSTGYIEICNSGETDAKVITDKKRENFICKISTGYANTDKNNLLLRKVHFPTEKSLERAEFENYQENTV